MLSVLLLLLLFFSFFLFFFLGFPLSNLGFLPFLLFFWFGFICFPFVLQFWFILLPLVLFISFNSVNYFWFVFLMIFSFNWKNFFRWIGLFGFVVFCGLGLFWTTLWDMLRKWHECEFPLIVLVWMSFIDFNLGFLIFSCNFVFFSISCIDSYCMRCCWLLVAGKGSVILH